MKKPIGLAAARAVRQRGATMIEILVSLVIATLGLVSLVALQARAYSAEAESYDRAQALMILEDMVQRINANRTRSGSYLTSDFGADASPGDCASADLASRDLCEWNEALTRILPGARACIETPGTSSTGLPGTEVLVTVVWRGTSSLGLPVASCAEDDFASEPGLRRAVSTVVRIGDLDG